MTGTHINWQLRSVMAEHGMFKTTDLVDPLRNAGVTLSREQVFRLVTQTPQRLNMEVLAALCTILSCTPNDLIALSDAAESSTRATGTGGPIDSAGTVRPVPARIQRPRNQ
ncbi:MAG: helix-turn-helix domain-containing protein [Canibacter sp.]